MIVGTLAMVETPGAIAFQIDSPKSADDIDSPLLDQKIPDSIEAVESEVLFVKTKPITAKILRTMKHLRTQAGPWARFRGLHIALIYAFIHPLAVMAFSQIIPFHPIFFANVLSTVILCRIQMTWVHVVMSLPSKKAWCRRMPSFKQAKNIIVPTILLALADHAGTYVPKTIFDGFGLDRHAQDPKRYLDQDLSHQKMILLEFLLVLVSGLVTNLLIILPARVTLTRVEASMLPEEHEPIVPFDRTFGGRVQPEILGGSGSVSMLDAWKSFDWSARIRLVKLFAKVALLELTTSVAFLLIGSVELMLILKNTNVDLAAALRAGKP